MATNDIDVSIYVLELYPSSTIHILYLVSLLNTDYAIGIHGVVSLSNHGQVST